MQNILQDESVLDAGERDGDAVLLLPVALAVPLVVPVVPPVVPVVLLWLGPLRETH